MRKAWSLLYRRRINPIAATLSVTISPSQSSHFIVPSTTTTVAASGAGGGEIVLPFRVGLKAASFGRRCYSSEPAVEEGDSDVAVIELLSKACRFSDVTKELEPAALSHDSILKVLHGLDGRPEVARGFFEWVVETDGGKLSSKSYNLMLGVLGCSKRVGEFWDLVDVMKKIGFGVSKKTFLMVSEVFEKEGLEADLNRLKEAIAPKQPRISKIVREGEWNGDDMQRLAALNPNLDKVSVTQILEELRTQPKKALMFFQWVSGSSSFEGDAEIYSVMAGVLGREDCIDEFWSIVGEMNRLNYEMEKETYMKVFEQFLKRKMVKEAVDLYEYKMQSSVKPSVVDGVLLMRKIAASNCPDMDLFARVVRIFTSGGSVLTKSILDSVVKSLRGAGNLGQCEKFLKAMEDGGLNATVSMHGQVVWGYCKARNFDEAGEYLVKVNTSECLDSKPWLSFMDELCRAQELDKAVYWFREMVDKNGPHNTGYVLHALVGKFCQMKKPRNANKFLVKMVEEKQVRTWRTTYEIMTKSLLSQGHLEEAINLIAMMKNQGIPPFWRLYISHISKSGTADDAINFLKNLSVQRFPSTSVFVETFKSFFKTGRLDEAYNLLSLSPSYIRNNADILELFRSKNSKKVVVPVV